MRRSSSFKDILIDLIEEYQDEILALDADYLEGGSARAEEKYDALHSGDLSLAMALTSNRRLKVVFQKIESKMNAISPRRSASETIRNLETRIARLERQASSQGLNIIYEKIEDLSKKHLKRLGKKYPLEGGGFNRIISDTFPLDLSAMELKEVTKYFTENQKRNVVIIKDDKEINSIVEKYLDRNEYFKPANARSAGGSPFCVLKSTKRGFVLELQMSTMIKNQKKRGPSPLDLIDLGFNQ